MTVLDSCLHRIRASQLCEKSGLNWQKSLANAITDPARLLQLLDLPRELLPGARQADDLFGLKVTHSYLQRIHKSDPKDPLLLQILPQLLETQPQPENYCSDPVGDETAMLTPGVIHKYHGRVLLITTGACAIHCRYCFRREFPYAKAHAGRNQWQAAVDYILANNSIQEVILSGGDPLLLSDQKLSDLCQRLETIPHLRRLRIHTRLPVVLPERINETLLQWMTGTRLQTVMVIHSNHPNEINEEVAAALYRLHSAGIPMFNQAVLLKHINDTADIQIALNQLLFKQNVVPYYLHILDPVRGAAHFAVSVEKARQIYDRLTESLPGYLLPKLAIEQQGMPAKTLLAPFQE